MFLLKVWFEQQSLASAAVMKAWLALYFTNNPKLFYRLRQIAREE